MAARPRSFALFFAVVLAAAAGIASMAEPIGSAADGSASANYGWGAPDAGLSDEFDGAGSPSSAFWDSYTSDGHDGNGLRRPGQNTIRDGVLQIAGNADAATGGMMSRAVYPSFGRWEVRMRVDKQGGGKPYHPVIALIPAGVPYDDGAGDLDFAEADAGTGEAFVFIHYPPRQQDYTSVQLDLAAWHTYAIEVAPEHISWFVDGALVMTDTNPKAITGAKWTTNVQLDANDPGGLAPSDMQVDYFRYFPLPPSGAPILPGPAPDSGDYSR